MNSAEEQGQKGQWRWLGAGLRLLVTFLFLLLILALSRCSLPSRSDAVTPTQVEASAQLRIEVRPSGATVFVNGLRSGSTPASLTLPPGQHTIRITQDGYEPMVETINLAADSDEVLTGELVAAPSSSGPSSTPTSTAVPASKEPQPDLVVSRMQVELESGGACYYVSTQLGVRVWVENVGGADAGPFVVEVNGTQQMVSEGLASGQSTDLWFTGYTQDGETQVSVDANDQVPEYDEGNNRLAQRLPIPTLPPTCTPSAPQPATSAPSTSLSPTGTPISAPSPPAAVTMREGQVTILTYPYAEFTSQAWNESFNMRYSVLDRAAYQASNPLPSEMTYNTFVVENEYLKLTFLPDVGGRLYEVMYKPTGHRETYRNPVLKPSPWGPAEQGWWLAAGGIEWCLPVEEHGYEWAVPWKLSASHDGSSVTVTLRDSDREDRVRADIAVRLEAGAGYFTVRPRLENPTSAPLELKYWTNAMLAPGGQNAPSASLRFVLPDAVTEVTIHSRGDESLPDNNERMAWPVAGGTDLSLLGNWSRWLGFFEDPAVGEFIAVYDETYDEGMVRAFSADAAQGAKAFAFGWQDPIPASNWTDDDSSYVEIHGGPAATFDDSVTILAGGHLQWSEIWYPVAGLGGLRYANGTAALNLTAGGGQVQIAVAAIHSWTGDLVVLIGEQEQWRQRASLVPGQPFVSTIALGDGIPSTGRVTLRLEELDGAVAAEYSTELNLK
jgi:hypothetical protein